ncbi:LysR family transcriptional regulator [Robbsia andropogonis]|uniref:LysR family transcriptional regulator n=1 Tax=Robbsia andropogonis TaxID=28092 RepID=A0A0F5K018_9BURK|nr:LysR family transcriptional regulator [Robbsia andropogonis]KKB63428.1 LysR family transcriptional regulator [Robbsia andropogonis]MCP1120391.1 LysR family transcriptional regulator [Robbsia andropogonis]MCP1130255.1 LysR family transcriptional regulator [Robbsia andropogonis]
MKVHHLQETALRYFVEVVRCGSITEASIRLGVAGSAISRQIAHLENVLETSLFDRRPRGMVPSAAGNVLAAHAFKAALDADHVIQQIADLQGAKGGSIRLTSSEGFAIEFLPGVITEYQKHYPGITFDVTVTEPVHVSRRIIEGDADIGFVFSRTPQKEIKVEHRQPAPVLAVMRPDHPLADRDYIDLAEMIQYPLALPDQSTTVRQLFDIACSLRQLLVEPAITSNFIVCLHSFVRAGNGITVSGEVSVRNACRRGDLVAKLIRDKALDARNLELQTLVGRTLPKPVQLFLDFLRNTLELEQSPFAREGRP